MTTEEKATAAVETARLILNLLSETCPDFASESRAAHEAAIEAAGATFAAAIEAQRAERKRAARFSEPTAEQRATYLAQVRSVSR